MATARLNGAFDTLSGTVDGWVYRRVHDRLVVARTPEPSDKPPTAGQRRARLRFAAAQEYMKRVLADPLQAEAYAVLAKALKRRADKIVAGDFLNPPEVQRIDLSGYHGLPGDGLAILAIDDVEVVSVEVVVTTAAGAVLERGAAAKVHGVWRYTVASALPPGDRVTITAIAKDRPGHEGTATVEYHGAA